MYQVAIKRVEFTTFYGHLEDLEFDPRLWKWNGQVETARYNTKHGKKRLKYKCSFRKMHKLNYGIMTSHLTLLG